MYAETDVIPPKIVIISLAFDDFCYKYVECSMQNVGFNYSVVRRGGNWNDKWSFFFF